MNLSHMRILTLALSLAILPPLAAQEAGTVESASLTGLPTQDPVVDAIYGIADEDLLVMQTLQELVEGIGPRLSSSDRLTEACEWARDKFLSYGFEDVRMEEWGSFPVGFNRRYAKGRMTAPVKRDLTFITRSWTPGTPGVVRGPALLAPGTEEQMAALEGKLQGAWIVVPTGGTAPRFGRDGDSVRERFGRMCDAEGIAGIIRPGNKSGLLVTSGNHRLDWDALPSRVFIQVLREQFTEIHQLLVAGEPVELEFDIDQEFVQGPIPLYNVIAEIPGTDLADELIIFGGHIDSWDGAGGAQDNGTGTSTTLEAARILMATLKELDLQPRRTIRFMLWSGEEQGLLGSIAYIEQHPEENERISACIVHDGGTNACSGIRTTPSMEPLFEEAFAPIIEHTKDNENEDLRFHLVHAARLPRGVGSDHDAYLSAGVPGFFWEQSGTASYTYVHHTQFDWVNQVIPEYQLFTSRVVASTAWRLANMEQAVPRDELGGERPRRKRIGVYLGEGLEVDGLVEGGLAEKAGIQRGDRILRLGDKTVETSREVAQVLRKVEKPLKVVWARGDKKMAAMFDWKEKTVTTVEP